MLGDDAQIAEAPPRNQRDDGFRGVQECVDRRPRTGQHPRVHRLVLQRRERAVPEAVAPRGRGRAEEAIAGPDAADPTASSEPVARYEAALDGNAKGLRIGVARDYYYDVVTLDVAFAALDDGTTYQKNTTLDAKAKQVRVVVAVDRPQGGGHPGQQRRRRQQQRVQAPAPPGLHGAGP